MSSCIPMQHAILLVLARVFMYQVFVSTYILLSPGTALNNGEKFVALAATHSRVGYTLHTSNIVFESWVRAPGGSDI